MGGTRKERKRKADREESELSGGADSALSSGWVTWSRRGDPLDFVLSYLILFSSIFDAEICVQLGMETARVRRQVETRSISEEISPYHRRYPSTIHTYTMLVSISIPDSPHLHYVEQDRIWMLGH